MERTVLPRLVVASFAMAVLLGGCKSTPPPADETPTEEGTPTDTPAEEPAEPAPEPKPTRRFVMVEGEVTLDGQPAAVDTEIPATAKIVTAASAHAVITLEPEGIVEIREKSTVEVGTSERRSNSLRLALGALWSFLPNPSSFEVVTNNATAGVRGTVFYVESRGDKESYICACDGDVEIVAANPKSFNKVIESSMEHKAVVLETRGKRQKAKKAKRVNHTDDEKMSLMPLIEVTKNGETPAQDDTPPEAPDQPVADPE